MKYNLELSSDDFEEIMSFIEVNISNHDWYHDYFHTHYRASAIIDGYCLAKKASMTKEQTDFFDKIFVRKKGVLTTADLLNIPTWRKIK